MNRTAARFPLLARGVFLLALSAAADGCNGFTVGLSSPETDASCPCWDRQDRRCAECVPEDTRPATPVCVAHAHLDGKGSCECDAGYAYAQENMVCALLPPFSVDLELLAANATVKRARERRYFEIAFPSEEHYVEVRNNGASVSPLCKVAYSLIETDTQEALHTCTWEFASVASGAVVRAVPKRRCLIPADKVPGDRALELRFMLDPDNDIREASEQNNDLSQPVSQPLL